MTEPVELDGPGGGGRTALVISIALFVIVALLVVLLATRDPSGERARESPLFGHLAPVTAGTTLDGDEIDIASYRGRFVVVNFFASWCTPCRQEHPELQAFDEDHRERGDAILVSVTYDNATDDARDFFEEQGGDWPVIDDEDNSIGVAYGVAQVPESFIVAPDGTVVHRFAGGVTQAELDEVLDAFSPEPVG